VDNFWGSCGEGLDVTGRLGVRWITLSFCGGGGEGLDYDTNGVPVAGRCVKLRCNVHDERPRRRNETRGRQYDLCGRRYGCRDRFN
jgi:hypothetical protein